MGPGLFSDIGKKTRDLLYQHYNTDQKFTLTSHTSQNVLVTTITQNDLLKPGLRGIFNLVVPDQRSGKVVLQYLHEYAGFTATAGLITNPVVGVSAVFGTSALSFGADVEFDTATSSVTKYNSGISLTTAELVVSLTLTNQGDSLNASYYHLVNPVTSIGAEVVHHLSNNTTSMAFGAQHVVESRTMVKTRVNSNGIASALLQHAWHPSSLISVSLETDILANDGNCRVGLALALRP